MSRTQPSADPGRSSGDDREGQTRRAADPESLLALLGDEYTQRVLQALGGESLTGSELIDRAGVSKATTYRRLADLRDAGLVEATIRLDPGGHHCEQYRLAVENLSITFGPEGFEVAIEEGSPEALDTEQRPALSPDG